MVNSRDTEQFENTSIAANDEVYNPDNLPHSLAKRWHSVSLQIRSRLAILVAFDHGKKSLKPGTASRLQNEIMQRCEYLALMKKTYEHIDRDTYIKTLRIMVPCAYDMWKRPMYQTEPSEVNEKALNRLLSSIPSSGELDYVETILEMNGISRKTFEKFLLRHNNPLDHV